MSHPTCDGKMTMQLMQGPEIQNGQWQFADFRCSQCATRCYRKRQLGTFYHSNWMEWIPVAWDEIREISNREPSTHDICQNINAKFTSNEINADVTEVAQHQCSECNMNCKAERALGYLWNGIWKVCEKQSRS